MPHLRRLPAAAIVTVFLALMPSSASAALDVKRVGTALTITGTTAGDTQIEIDADQSVFVAGSEVAVGTSTPTTCSAKGSYVECGDADLTSLSVSLTGTGDDNVQITDAPFMPAATLTVGTGPGDDELLFFGEQRVIANLGSGDDRATTDAGEDELRGGPGDDILSPGASDDQVWGDDGNDRFSADGAADGDDTFDGGADTQAPTGPVGSGPAGSAGPSPANLSGLGGGDTVDYGARTAPVAIRLPADSRTVPEGDNGASTEHDRLAHVESAVGAGSNKAGEGAGSTLVGNERANALVGGLGADNLSGADGNDLLRGDLGDDRYDGGDGDDLLDARTGASVPTSAGDIDSELTCATGNDGLRRDPVDPQGVGCEHLAPLFLGPLLIEGNPRVGNALTIGRSGVVGEVTAVTATWFSCPAGSTPKPGQAIDDPALGCRAAGAASTFVPHPDRDLGRVVHAVPSFLWTFGDESGGLTAAFGPLTEALPTDPVIVQRPETDTGSGTQPIPGEPFAQFAKRAAIARLGSGAVLSNIALGNGTAVYETPASRGGKIPVTPTSRRTIAAVVCEKACALTVEGRVTLTVASRSKRKRTQLVKLKKQAFALAAGSSATVPFNASASQRRRMQAAKKAKLSLTFVLRAADGTTRRATKRYVVKVHAAGTPGQRL
ncbi:MAG: hypothetical protein Q7T55_15175 [Solirubrobacteraceae bacterium]|nr:hypothetical protein [Solirubrobacteraceae bacterium]